MDSIPTCPTCDDPLVPGMDPSNITAEDVERLMEAQSEHARLHEVRPVLNHIRKQINPRRIRTGNQFYKDRVKLGAAENGSQTLCGDPATTEDLSWAETRSVRSHQYVRCPSCPGIRAGS